MTADNCLFCKIAAGVIPSSKVYEDEDVLAFDDIAPMMPVHTLVIPKAHFDGLSDDVPAEVLGKIMTVCAKVAEIKGIQVSGYRVATNCGPDAGQVVPHLHFHVLGGAPMNSGNPAIED